jgi:SAM-dependent methyltransferase
VTGTTLDALGLRHGTDKASRAHGYLPVYEEFLGPLRDREITLLEIGVKEGASLRVWHDYFPRGRIVGVDLRRDVDNHAGGRIAIERADQGDPAALAAIIDRHGPFDVVIEDGSHFWRHQVLAIRTLVPALKPGGLFVSEDLQVSFPPLDGHYGVGAERSAWQVLMDLAERVMRARDKVQPPDLEPDLQALVPLLSWVLVLRHAVILRRRG